MPHCIFLDGGYHGEKLHDPEYQSCHESSHSGNDCPETRFQETTFPEKNFPDNSFPFHSLLLRMIELIGSMLTAQGYQVCYTRCDDTIMTPSKVAEIANDGLCQGTTDIRSQDSCLLSFHRSLLLCPGACQTVEIFVYKRNSPSSRLAHSILEELQKEGYHSLGIQERPNLTILRRTNMPAIFITLGNLPLSSSAEKENDRLIVSTADAFVRGITNYLSE